MQYLDLFYGDISLSADGNSYRKCEECGASYKMFTYIDQVGDEEESPKPLHYGTKLGHFETSKIHFPTSEGVSEVSE